jgi:hypothetical protein
MAEMQRVQWVADARLILLRSTAAALRAPGCQPAVPASSTAVAGAAHLFNLLWCELVCGVCWCLSILRKLLLKALDV